MTRDGAVVVGGGNPSPSPSARPRARSSALRRRRNGGARRERREDDRDAFLLGEDDREGIEPGDELETPSSSAARSTPARLRRRRDGLERWNVSMANSIP